MTTIVCESFSILECKTIVASIHVLDNTGRNNIFISVVGLNGVRCKKYSLRKDMIGGDRDFVRIGNSEIIGESNEAYQLLKSNGIIPRESDETVAKMTTDMLRKYLRSILHKVATLLIDGLKISDEAVVKLFTQ